MCADADNQIVSPVPANCVRDVKYRSCEAGKVLSNLLAVQPNCCTKLSFVDAQDSNAALSRDFEGTVIFPQREQFPANLLDGLLTFLLRQGPIQEDGKRQCRA